METLIFPTYILKGALDIRIPQKKEEILKKKYLLLENP